MNVQKSKKGFTLIELIIVIAIIAIIVAAVFVAMDPVKRLNASRNSTRRTDVTAIAQAIQVYSTDTLAGGGSLAHGIDTDGNTWQQIGTAAAGCNDVCGSVTPAAACIPLTVLVTPGNYLPRIPSDPTTGTDAETRYVVNISNGATVVRACDPQGEDAGGTGTPPAIEASR